MHTHTPTHTHRQPLSKRKTSVKVRAIGIFPGSKVVRGKNWQWNDQDGGQGSEGEVKGYENTSSGSSRNRVLVEWPHGVAISYRLGLHGNVDIMCVEEEVGPFYYRDHLPLLGKVSNVVPNNLLRLALCNLHDNAHRTMHNTCVNSIFCTEEPQCRNLRIGRALRTGMRLTSINVCLSEQRLSNFISSRVQKKLLPKCCN